jgi:ribosomal protein S18 acetylase RimI-like enzyme
LITIQPLTHLSPAEIQAVITGYTSDAIYEVSRTESAEESTFSVRLTPLCQPVTKRYSHLDEETMAQYIALCPLGFSFGAYEGEQCIGLALAEPHDWNQSLWVWEFHIAESHRGQGAGRRLMEALVERARGAGLRTIVCETQTTNVPAIRFYRALGFTLDGIDLSYYSNQDYVKGEIALFMKRALD